MELLKKLFAKPKKPQPRFPVPGERWCFGGGISGDPFPPKGGVTVRILDVKDGWVRYYMSELLPDERMNMSSFLYCYSPPPASQGEGE